jgi:hypothetical protein
MMERTSEFEGGAIGVIELARFNAPPEMITPETSPYNTTRNASQGIFKTPYPIMDGGRERILVAQSPREVGGDIRNPSVNYDLFVMDKDGGNMRVIHSDPDFNDYDPVVVEPRVLPITRHVPKPEVAEGLRTKAPTGIFFTANIYSRMQNDGHMRPDPAFKNADGTVGQGRYFRFLEAVSITRGMGGGNVGDTEFEKQRVIGYGDIRPDGSFSAEVPANKPLHLQVLDQNGMMLVNQLQWINVMPGERRVCTGCHGPRDRDADIHGFKVDESSLKVTFNETQEYISSFANAQKVSEHPAARTDTVDFLDLNDRTRTNTVQHVLDTRCNSCHGVSEASSLGGGLVLEDVADTAVNRGDDGVSTVYQALTRDNGYQTAKSATRLSYVTSDGARNSPLAWVLYNRQLARESGLYRETSHDHSATWKDSSGRIDPFAPDNRDLLTLIEWMDMGVQFSNSVRRNTN